MIIDDIRIPTGDTGLDQVDARIPKDRNHYRLAERQILRLKGLESEQGRKVRIRSN
jgi:hypothetical protein